jgi:N-acetylneuraminic acid mutarotase
MACSGGGSSSDPNNAPDCGTNCLPNEAPTAARPAGTPAATATVAAPTGNPWSTKAPLLAANSEIAVAQLDGKIYVIGGYPSSRFVQNTVQVYDIATDRWQYTPPLPAPVHHTMAAGVNGKLYVIGGETAGSGATNGAQPGAYQGFVDHVYEYDPKNPGWVKKASMPTQRSGGAAAVLDNKIYVVGGRPPGGADFAVYDPARDAWTQLPDMPTQRNHLAADAIDGKIYVAGGRFGGGVGSEMTARVEAFDPRTNTWERKADMPTVRAGVNGIAARGCLYVFGGEGNDKQPNGVFEEMEVYNPKTNSWQKLTPLPTPVHGVTGAAYADGLIFLPGGGISRGGSSGVTLHQTFRADVSC